MGFGFLYAKREAPNVTLAGFTIGQTPVD